MFRIRRKNSPSYRVIKSGVDNLGREEGGSDGWIITKVGMQDVELVKGAAEHRV